MKIHRKGNRAVHLIIMLSATGLGAPKFYALQNRQGWSEQ